MGASRIAGGPQEGRLSHTIALTTCLNVINIVGNSKYWPGARRGTGAEGNRQAPHLVGWQGPSSAGAPSWDRGPGVAARLDRPSGRPRLQIETAAG